MLRKSQFCTPQATKHRRVQALLLPKILYCSQIYMGVSRSSWDKLNVTFNNCVRYIFNLKSHDPISHKVKEFLGCTLENFIHLRARLFIFMLLRHKSPSYLFEKIVFPRHPRGRVLSFSGSSHTPQRRASFFIKGIHLWNSMSSEIRLLESAITFKKECLSLI
jgi:hypothetical protein